MDEQQLIAAARDNPEAVRALYQHYFPRIFSYVAYRIGREADVEDVVSDIFLKMTAGLNGFTYRGEGSFAAWLFKIANNAVISYYRQNPKRNAEIPLEDLPEIHSSIPMPDQMLMQKERFARLRAMIQTLAPRRQEVVTLKFFGGLRNQEIAEAIGLDERTVASHLSRALNDLYQKFRIELGEQNHE